MSSASNSVWAGLVMASVCLLSMDVGAALRSQEAEERILEVLGQPNASDTVNERSAVLDEIRRSSSLRENNRVRLALIAALDRANEEYFASWLTPDSNYTEGQGEFVQFILEAVISLRDVRAIPALVKSVDTGPLAWRALAGFGEMAVAPIMEAWNERTAGAVYPAWRGRGLVNALAFIVAAGELGSVSLARIHDVARGILEKPIDSYDLVNAMELAVVLEAPDLVAQMEAIAGDPRGELERRGVVVDARRGAQLRRYARENLAKLAR